jgi:hypothetical protein
MNLLSNNKNPAFQGHNACCVKALVLNMDKTKLYVCVRTYNPNTDFLYHIPCFKLIEM